MMDHEIYQSIKILQETPILPFLPMKNTPNNKPNTNLNEQCIKKRNVHIWDILYCLNDHYANPLSIVKSPKIELCLKWFVFIIMCRFVLIKHMDLLPNCMVIQLWHSWTSYTFKVNNLNAKMLKPSRH